MQQRRPRPLDRAARRRAPRPPSGRRRRRSAGVTQHHVGRAGGELERHAAVGQGHHQGLALRRPGHDRRALHAEEAALEVDVVELVPVDEAAGGDVADDGVVLPAVPEPAHDLDGVGRLVEQLAAATRASPAARRTCGGRRGPPRPAGPTAGAATRPAPGSRSRAWRWPTRRGTARCGSWSTVGTRPMWRGERGHQRGDEHGVEAAPHLVGAVVGRRPPRASGARRSPRS